MSLIELGALGEFIGSIAVLATLVYLVFQIRQNTLSIRSQSRFHVLEALNADMKLQLDSEFTQLVAKSGSGDASINERRKLGWVWASLMSHLEMLYFEIEEGALPKTFESTLKFRVASTFLPADANALWEVHRRMFTGDFRSYVDAQLREGAMDEVLMDDSPADDNPFDWISIRQR